MCLGYTESLGKLFGGTPRGLDWATSDFSSTVRFSGGLDCNQKSALLCGEETDQYATKCVLRNVYNGNSFVYKAQGGGTKKKYEKKNWANSSQGGNPSSTYPRPPHRKKGEGNKEEIYYSIWRTKRNCRVQNTPSPQTSTEKSRKKEKAKGKEKGKGNRANSHFWKSQHCWIIDPKPETTKEGRGVKKKEK